MTNKSDRSIQTCGDTVREITDRFQAKVFAPTSSQENSDSGISTKDSVSTPYEDAYQKYLKELAAHYNFHEAERKQDKRLTKAGVVGLDFVLLSTSAIRKLMS
jgi:hypothetical protein